jgi:UDP-glucuronate 4-epimerase
MNKPNSLGLDWLKRSQFFPPKDSAPTQNNAQCPPKILGPVLVTGAVGFIGYHLCMELLELGVDVIGIDAFVGPTPRKQQEASAQRLTTAGAQILRGNIIDIDLSTIVSRVATVFHLAGRPGVRDSFGSEFENYVTANIVGTRRLLEACTKYGHQLRSFVYASTSSVYGEPEIVPTPEWAPTHPQSPYAVTKLAGEHLVLAAAKLGHVPGMAVRYFTVYGPGQRPDMAISNFISAIRGGHPLHILGDGEQLRDFTEVSDIVRGTILAAAQAHVGHIFNLACGSAVSLRTLISEIEESTRQQAKVVYKPAALGDVRVTTGDISKALDMLGWKPLVSLREGLHRQLNEV